MKKRIFIILLLLNYCQITNSQSISDTIKISEVSIVEKRSFNLQKFDSISQLNTIVAGIDNIVKYLPNISVRNYGNGLISTFSVRGTNASHNQIIWNGIVLNSSLNSSVDLSNIPVYFIDNVEIIDGSKTLNNSYGALGGILELNTANNNKLFEYIQEISSYNTWGEYLKFNICNKILQNSTKIFYKKSDNDYKFNNIYVIPKEVQYQFNSAYYKAGLLNETNFEIFKNTKTKISYWFNKSNTDIPPIILNYNSKNYSENQLVNSHIVTFNNSYNKSKNVINLNVGYSSTKVNYNLIHDVSNSNKNIINSISISNDLVTKISSEFRLKKMLLINDFESKYQFSEYQSVQNQNYKRIINSLFSGIKFNKNLVESVIAFRVINNINTTFHPLITNKLYLNKAKNIDLNLDISTNSKIPSFNDLYFFPGGNPNLKNEDSRNLDLYLNYQKTVNLFSFNFSLKSHYSIIDNWIMWKPSSYGFWTAENVKSVHSKGISNVIKIYSKSSYKYSFELNSTYLNIYNIENPSFQMIYVPEFMTNLIFNYWYKNFKLTSLNHYESRRSINLGNQNSSFLNSHLINDISLSYILKRKRINSEICFSINNIFNEQYQLIAWRPMPLRNYSIILKINL